jgi:hypothetical protein
MERDWSAEARSAKADGFSRAALERRIVEAPLDRCAEPRCVQFLFRLYAMTGRDDLEERTGLSLAAALRDYGQASSIQDRSAWLEVFVEAWALTEDARVAGAVADLIESVRAGWTAGSIAERAAGVDACLRAAALPEHRDVAAEAIDQLEGIVRPAYRPGSGVGAFADQIGVAGALLSAYQLSGRLPYPMLAEELIAAAGPVLANEEFTVSCQAARVLCRLALLHGDDDYRRAAIVAPRADYRRDAEAILERRSVEADRLGAAGAIYGVALLELESTHPSPQ